MIRDTRTNIGGFLGEWIENSSEAPADLKEFGNDLNNWFISVNEDIQQGLAAAEENVTQNKVEEYAGDFLEWLKSPVNVAFAVGAFLLIIKLFRK